MKTDTHYFTSTGHETAFLGSNISFVWVSMETCMVWRFHVSSTKNSLRHTQSLFQTELVFNLVCYGKLWASFPLRYFFFHKGTLQNTAFCIFYHLSLGEKKKYKFLLIKYLSVIPREPGLYAIKCLSQLLDIQIQWSSSQFNATHTLVYMAKGEGKSWWKNTIGVQLPDTESIYLQINTSLFPSRKCRWHYVRLANGPCTQRVIKISSVSKSEVFCQRGKSFGTGLKVSVLGISSILITTPPATMYLCWPLFSEDLYRKTLCINNGCSHLQCIHRPVLNLASKYQNLGWKVVV